jgi:hypothetical protein
MRLIAIVLHADQYNNIWESLRLCNLSWSWKKETSLSSSPTPSKVMQLEFDSNEF